jgi:hypothetical protein
MMRAEILRGLNRWVIWLYKHTKTPVNGVKTPFSEVNKRKNAFWEVHIQTKNFTKNVCVLKNDTKLFIYDIYICLLYVYIRLFNLFIVCLSCLKSSHTIATAITIAVV